MRARVCECVRACVHAQRRRVFSTKVEDECKVKRSTAMFSCTQMIRKRVETRDWLNTIEPRNVRSVMKRVVEEVTLIDRQVATLYEEGAKKDQGSGQCHISVGPFGSGVVEHWLRRAGL